MFLDVLSHLFYAWNQPKIYVIWIESLNLVVDTVFVRAAPQFFFSTMRWQKWLRLQSECEQEGMERDGSWIETRTKHSSAVHRIVSKWNPMKIDCICTYMHSELEVFNLLGITPSVHTLRNALDALQLPLTGMKILLMNARMISEFNILITCGMISIFVQNYCWIGGLALMSR